MTARFWQRAIDQFGAIIFITVAERIICNGYLDIWVYLGNLTWISGIGLIVSLFMYAHTVAIEKTTRHLR